MDYGWENNNVPLKIHSVFLQKGLWSDIIFASSFCLPAVFHFSIFFSTAYFSESVQWSAFNKENVQNLIQFNSIFFPPTICDNNSTKLCLLRMRGKVANSCDCRSRLPSNHPPSAASAPRSKWMRCRIEQILRTRATIMRCMFYFSKTESCWNCLGQRLHGAKTISVNNTRTQRLFKSGAIT